MDMLRIKAKAAFGLEQSKMIVSLSSTPWGVFKNSAAAKFGVQDVADLKFRWDGDCEVDEQDVTPISQFLKDGDSLTLELAQHAGGPHSALAPAASSGRIKSEERESSHQHGAMSQPMQAPASRRPGRKSGAGRATSRQQEHVVFGDGAGLPREYQPPSLESGGENSTLGSRSFSLCLAHARTL